MKKDIKVEVKLTEGFKERFTEACIKVAKRRVEEGKKPRKAAV